MTDSDSITAAITDVIRRMEAAWNRGDFAGYMAGFADPDVVFVSRGVIQDGWQGTLDHYIRDYGGTPGSQGQLRFYDLQIDPISADSAMLIGRYDLQGGRAPQTGINTRLFRLRPEGWRITMNHVSQRQS